MKKTSETIVFFGNERLATGVSTDAPTLRGLIDAGYRIAAVVSNYEKGRSRKARELEIATLAEEHSIPLLLPERPNDIKEQLAEYGAAVGVLVAYGRIVPQSIIDIFPKGILNIHPSLLPLHRGPTPIESVILEGTDRTGVSIMRLAKEMDAGPVFGQSEVILKGNETKQQLADELLEIGGAMLIELLPGILDGTTAALPQDESRATYDGLISKGNGVIDWNKPAKNIEREIRAYQKWPASRTKLAGKDVIITQAHAVPSESTGGMAGDIEADQDIGIIMIHTSNGTLCVDKLKPAGKNEMTAKEFIAGHRDQF